MHVVVSMRPSLRNHTRANGVHRVVPRVHRRCKAARVRGVPYLASLGYPQRRRRLADRPEDARCARVLATTPDTVANTVSGATKTRRTRAPHTRGRQGLFCVPLLLVSCGHPAPSVRSDPATAAEASSSGSSGGSTCLPLRHWIRRAESGMSIHPRTPDLDGVAPQDVVMSLGSCGNWGDCVHVVLQGCGTDEYRAVWGPDYAQAIEVLENGNPPADLLVRSRTARSGCDLPVQEILRWQGNHWVSVERCTGNGVWTEDVCGQLPAPPCTRE